MYNQIDHGQYAIKNLKEPIRQSNRCAAFISYPEQFIPFKSYPKQIILLKSYRTNNSYYPIMCNVNVCLSNSSDEKVRASETSGRGSNSVNSANGNASTDPVILANGNSGTGSAFGIYFPELNE